MNQSSQSFVSDVFYLKFCFVSVGCFFFVQTWLFTLTRFTFSGFVSVIGARVGGWAEPGASLVK